jgi:flagellin FlaB
MNMKKTLMNFAKQKRGMVGLEAAIVLIAFVIIAAVFSFMVVNQGIFATEQGKTVIQQGLQQASSPVAFDGTGYVKTSTDGSKVVGILIPLKTFGTNTVSFISDTTVVTLKTGSTAYANVYYGVNATTSGATFDDMLTNTTVNAGALYIHNTNGDQALDSSEKGYLVIRLDDTNGATARAQVTIEVRLEKAAPLSIVFTVPESMPADYWVNI